MKYYYAIQNFIAVYLKVYLRNGSHSKFQTVRHFYLNIGLQTLAGQLGFIFTAQISQPEFSFNASAENQLDLDLADTILAFVLKYYERSSYCN